MTPDSNGEVVYHYHVQHNPPFTFGCYGPNTDGTEVTLEQCKALYPGCSDGTMATLNTAAGNVDYNIWCPCWLNDNSSGSDDDVSTNEPPTLQPSASPFVATNAPNYSPTPIPTARGGSGEYVPRACGPLPAT